MGEEWAEATDIRGHAQRPTAALLELLQPCGLAFVEFDEEPRWCHERPLQHAILLHQWKRAWCMTGAREYFVDAAPCCLQFAENIEVAQIR